MSCYSCSTPESCRRKGCQGSTVNAGTKPMNYVLKMPIVKRTKPTKIKLKKA